MFLVVMELSVYFLHFCEFLKIMILLMILKIMTLIMMISIQEIVPFVECVVINRDLAKPIYVR